MSAVIDAHVHVFRSQSHGYPRVVDAIAPAAREAPVELLLATMASAGVDRAVLVALSAHDRYVRECLDAHPDRFVGVLVGDPGAPGNAAAARARLVAPGVRGLRLHRLGDPSVSDVRQLETFPVLAVLAELDAVLWLYAPPDQVALLPRVLEALPGLRVLLNHLGFAPARLSVDALGRPQVDTAVPPTTLPAVLALAAYPHVSVMLSGHYAFSRLPPPYADLHPIVEQLYQAYGAAQLLWASDFPWVLDDPGYPEQLALVPAALPRLTEAERRAIMGGNAGALLRLAEEPRSPQ